MLFPYIQCYLVIIELSLWGEILHQPVFQSEAKLSLLVIYSLTFDFALNSVFAPYNSFICSDWLL